MYRQIRQKVTSLPDTISNNHDLRDIFPRPPPLLVLRHTQNQGERLVRANITSDTDLEFLPYDLLPGEATS